MTLSDQELRTLELTNIFASTISAVGSAFVIFCFMKFVELRTFAFKLVFFIAVSDLIFEFGNMLGDAGGNPATHLGANPLLCTLQGLLIGYGELASMLWSVSLAFTLERAFLKEDPAFSPQHIGDKSLVFHSICWGYPALMSILPLTTGSYDDTGGWCWITDENDIGHVWRFLQYYVPLWLGVAYNTYVYYHIRKKMLHMYAQASGGSNEASNMINRMKLYPLVLIVCNAPGFVNAFMTAVIGDDVFVLNWFHVFFAASQGGANALVYGLTPSIRNTFWAWFQEKFCQSSQGMHTQLTSLDFDDLGGDELGVDHVEHAEHADEDGLFDDDGMVSLDLN